MRIDQKVRNYIDKNKLLDAQAKVLLAVSGGKDSMLMLYLFYRLGITFEVAHCNFGLRGEESDGDEQLVKSYCDELNVRLHVKYFNTLEYAHEQRVSIQLAARDLRYRWFQELAAENGCSEIAIAQHKNDHVETVLLNIMRGTGLTGLQGILPKRANIIRPLLFLTAQEIVEAVLDFKVPYRDDLSNFSTKYARNKIRLDIIPQFEILSADFIQVMDDNIVRFQDANRVLQMFVADLREEMFLPVGEERWFINKMRLKEKDSALVYFLFEPFSFTKSVVEDLHRSLYNEAGRIFESPVYRILTDRTLLILEKKSKIDEEIIFVNAEDKYIGWQDKVFQTFVSNNLEIVKDNNQVKFDLANLVFPLCIRNWKEGDSFQPLGMKGKKKVSDLFVSKKIPVFDKKKIPIWLNGNGDIIWIAGLQMDDRYKITEKTQKVLTLVLVSENIQTS